MQIVPQLPENIPDIYKIISCVGVLIAGLNFVLSHTPADPNIVSFYVFPEKIDIGDNSTLHWEVANGDRITIESDPTDDDLPRDPIESKGSLQINPEETTMYIIKAKNNAGKIKDDITNLVVRPLTIESFYADPSSIDEGESSRLYWVVNGASLSKSKIDNVIESLDYSNGYALIRPSSTTTYTLSTVNSAGRTKTEDVTVSLNPPSINSFYADPAVINDGESTILYWNVTGSSLSKSKIDPSVGSLVYSNGHVSVKPDSTTTYALTAVNSDGVKRSKEITVALRPVTIDSFYADPVTIDSGESAELHWKVSGASLSKSKIDHGIGSLGYSEGMATVKPESSTTYLLTATNGDGKETTKRAVVNVRPFSIDSFYADSSIIDKGRTTTLHWKVTGASLSKSKIDPEIGSLYYSDGMATITPDSTTTYTLTAFNGAGKTITKKVPVRVRSLSIDSFYASPSYINYGGTSTLYWKITGALLSRCSIRPEIGILKYSDGFAYIRPSSTTTYTLTATDDEGESISKEITVFVLKPYYF